MNLSCTPIRAFALLAAGVLGGRASAQTAPDPAAAAVPVPPPVLPKPKPHLPKPPKEKAGSYNTNLIVLDPGHGGTDTGAKLGENSFEKDATIALAGRLRARLQAQGFTVVLTHESAGDNITADQRIELANKGHALACLLLHASNGGHGLHLYTSALTPARAPDPREKDKPIALWDTAQAPMLTQSQRLISDLTPPLNGLRVPLVAGQASVRPIDSLTCPAVALELSPQNANGDKQTPASDGLYQDRVANAVTTALTIWRGHVISAAAAAQQTASPSSTPGAASKPEPKPASKPASNPKASAKPRPAVDVPEQPISPDAVKPRAPVERRPPPPPEAPRSSNPGGAP